MSVDQPKPQVDEQIFEAYKTVRNRQWAASSLAVCIAVPLMIVRRSEGEFILGLPAEWVALAGFAAILVILAFSMYNWRCPSCKKALGKGSDPDFCPKCGTQLHE